MAFAVSEFKSNLKQGGARPSLFSVSLSYPIGLTPPTKSEFLVKNTIIPTSTIGTYDVHFHGKAIRVAGDRTFETWDTTIINDEDFGIRNVLERWMDGIANQLLNTRSDDLKRSLAEEGTQARYKTDIKVTQFSKSGKALRDYHFMGAFPTLLSSINLGWDVSDIEEYTCTWAYDYWIVPSETIII